MFADNRNASQYWLDWLRSNLIVWFGKSETTIVFKCDDSPESRLFTTSGSCCRNGLEALVSDPFEYDLLSRALADANCASDFDEQHTIANILGTLDDKIELNRRMNESAGGDGAGALQVVVRGLRPVRAKVEGCDRAYPSTSPTYSLIPSRIRSLGEIPTDWVSARTEVNTRKFPLGAFTPDGE